MQTTNTLRKSQHAGIAGVLAMSLIALVLMGMGPSLPASGATPSVDSFVASYFHAMDSAFMPGATPVAILSPYFPSGGDVTTGSQSLLGYETAIANQFRSYTAAHSYTIKSITTSVTVNSVTVAPSGLGATLDVATTMTMLWSPSAVPVTTQFTAGQRVVQ